MSELFELIIKSNTINFLIVLSLIIFLIKKLNLAEKISKLRDEIKNYVNDSEKEKASADEGLDKIKGKIEKLPLLIDRIEKSAQHNVKNIEERVKAETENQKKDIENNLNRLLNLETKKFNSKLISLLSEKSVEVAMKNAIKQLNSEPELHNVYINNAIDEIDRINL